VRFWIEVEGYWGQLRSGLANIETHNRPLATVLELCNEAWNHTILSEHSIFWPQMTVTSR